MPPCERAPVVGALPVGVAISSGPLPGRAPPKPGLVTVDAMLAPPPNTLPPSPACHATPVETLRDHGGSERERLYLHAARLIEATYAITARERHDAVRYVADGLVPLT